MRRLRDLLGPERRGLGLLQEVAKENQHLCLWVHAQTTDLAVIAHRRIDNLGIEFLRLIFIVGSNGPKQISWISTILRSVGEHLPRLKIWYKSTVEKRFTFEYFFIHHHSRDGGLIILALIL